MANNDERIEKYYQLKSPYELLEIIGATTRMNQIMYYVQFSYMYEALKNAIADVLATKLQRQFAIEPVHDSAYEQAHESVYEPAYSERVTYMKEAFATIDQRFYVKFINYLNEDKERETKAVTSTLLQFCESEINRLRNKQEEMISLLVGDVEPSVDSAIEELKAAIKKGDRVNFKLLQELLLKVETMADLLDNREKEAILLEQAHLKKSIEQQTEVMLDIFDLLDYMKHSMEEGDPSYTQVEGAVEKALQLLDSSGMEEIKALHEPFDAETMEGIGTVPEHDVPADLPKYRVYVVHQRGFKYKETNELIRRAKVITVY